MNGKVKRYNFLKITITAIAIVGIYLVFTYNKSSTDLNKVENENISDQIATTNLSDPKNILYQVYSTLIIPSDGCIIDKDILVEDSNLEKIPIKTLLDNKRTLYFRYSYADCDWCVQSTIKLLKKEFLNDETNKVILLTNSYSERDFLLKEKYNKSLFPTFEIVTAKGLGIPLENKTLPFLFTVENYAIQKIFIPQRADTLKTIEYLKYIHSYLNTLQTREISLSVN